MARTLTGSRTKTSAKRKHVRAEPTLSEYGPAQIVAYEDTDYPEFPKTFLVELGKEFFQGSYYRHARVDNCPIEIYAMTRCAASYDVTKVIKTVERDQEVLAKRAVKVYLEKVLRPQIDEMRENARLKERLDLLSRPSDWQVTISERQQGEYSIGVQELELIVVIGEDESEAEQEQKQAVVSRMFDLIKKYGLGGDEK